MRVSNVLGSEKDFLEEVMSRQWEHPVQFLLAQAQDTISWLCPPRGLLWQFQGVMEASMGWREAPPSRKVRAAGKAPRSATARGQGSGDWWSVARGSLDFNFMVYGSTSPRGAGRVVSRKKKIIK